MRIEDVPVRPAVRGEEIGVVGGCRHGRFVGIDRAEHPARVHGVFDADRPQPLAGRGAAKILVAAGVDEAVGAMTPQHVGGEFDGEAFRDAAEIDLDAWPREAHGALRGIEKDVAIIHERPHRGELLARRHVRLLVVESPQPHQRADRDVERAPASRAHITCRRQHAEHRIARRYRLPRRRPIDERELAVVPIIAHQPIDFGHRRERFVDCR